MNKFENFIRNQIIPTLPQALPSWGKQSDNTGEKEMRKSEHTPGPWGIVSMGDWHAVTALKDGVRYFVTAGGCGCCNEIEECIEKIEDARLIAAAPDLLESLTNLVGLAKLGAASLDKYHAALSDAEAALAKARGEA